jgi:hypothetical protein
MDATLIEGEALEIDGVEVQPAAQPDPGVEK